MTRLAPLLLLLLHALLPAACSDDTGPVGSVDVAADVAVADEGSPFVPTGDAGSDGAGETTAQDVADAHDAADEDEASADADPDTAQDTGTDPDHGPQDVPRRKPGDPDIAVDPEQHTFSYISPLDGSLVRDVYVANLGGAPLTLTSVALEPGSSEDFDVVLVPPTPKVVEPGKQTMVRIAFHEGDGGDGTLVLESDDPDEPTVEVALSSHVKATVRQPKPCAEIVPSKLDFGTVVRGTTATKQAALRNCSDSEVLTLDDITRGTLFFVPLTEEFQVDPFPTLPSSLGPGQTLPVTVTYTPKLAGPDSGFFVLHTDDPNAPEQHLDVSGLGTAPPPEELELTIKLSWDADLSDVDSHLIEPGGTLFDCQSDCYFGNPAPDWGVQGDWVDDPFLDVDDVDGFGPEHINISEPQPGSYTYVVHYYDDTYEGSFPTSTEATVEVLSHGQTLATFGPQHLDATNRTWDVFTIDIPSFTITPLGNTWMIPGSQVQSCGFSGFP
ncbi:MAG: choice-of-anchor D domain-containing protein [Myxococcota bacterium]